MVLTVLLLLAVVAVFLAPAVDLEPTALRAMRAAVLFFFAILIAARFSIQICRHYLKPESSIVHDHQPSESPRPPDLNLFDLYCTHLC